MSQTIGYARVSAAAVLAVIAALMMTACAPDHGTVTNRREAMRCNIRNQVPCKTGWEKAYELEITDPAHRDPLYTDRPASGWTDVTKQVYGRCPQGAAWPDCKDGAR